MRRAKVLQALSARLNINANVNVEEKSESLPNVPPAENSISNDKASVVLKENNQTTRSPSASTHIKNSIIHEEDHLEDLDKWDPMSEDFESALNTLDLNPDNDPHSEITGRKNNDGTRIGEHQICDFYLKHGHCSDGDYCDRLHLKPQDRDRIANLQEIYKSKRDRVCLNYVYLSPIELEPNPDALLLVSVTMFKSPNDFYIVCPYDKMNFAVCTSKEIDFYIKRVVNSSNLKTKLQRCHEQLSILFDHNYRIDNVNEPIFRGQIVACKLPDGRFCRAEVLDTENPLEDKFLYKIFLIDIGIEVELPREAIYDIKAQCLSEPPMAVNCRLGLRATDCSVGWSQEAMELFAKHVTGNKYLFCQILQHSQHERSQFTVDLIDLTEKFSLTDRMLANGYAERF